MFTGAGRERGCLMVGAALAKRWRLRRSNGGKAIIDSGLLERRSYRIDRGETGASRRTGQSPRFVIRRRSSSPVARR